MIWYFTAYNPILSNLFFLRKRLYFNIIFDYDKGKDALWSIKIQNLAILGKSTMIKKKKQLVASS